MHCSGPWNEECTNKREWAKASPHRIPELSLYVDLSPPPIKFCFFRRLYTFLHKCFIIISGREHGDLVFSKFSLFIQWPFNPEHAREASASLCSCRHCRNRKHVALSLSSQSVSARDALDSADGWGIKEHLWAHGTASGKQASGGEHRQSNFWHSQAGGWAGYRCAVDGAWLLSFLLGRTCLCLPFAWGITLVSSSRARLGDL